MSAPFPMEHGERKGESIVLLHGGNVANWMWEPQIAGLSGRHVITPDVVGFGTRADQGWPGFAGAADDIAQVIRERAVDGRAHIVGLSMGAIIAVHLLARHPSLVRSAMVSGAALNGIGRGEGAMARLQLSVWERRWFWSAQAVAFRLPPDSRDVFIETGMRVRKETAEGMFAEVLAGAMPAGPFEYDGPLLAVAGGRESRTVAASFPALRAAMPQTRTWIAPRMPHIWSIQDPALFTRTIVDFVDGDVVPAAR